MIKKYPFEYFSGANVVVYMDDFPLLECAGFSYSVRESKRPIYGYASRLFDGVARGQVLVEGTMVINYVHQDYLYSAATLASQGPVGLAEPQAPLYAVPPPEDEDLLPLEPNFEDEEFSEANISGRMRYWLQQEVAQEQPIEEIRQTFNMHDSNGGFNIRVSFGRQGGTVGTGKTGFLLSGVHFLGRGTRIEIDAETIVEAYSFFARNVYSTRPNYSIQRTVNPNGTVRDEIRRMQDPVPTGTNTTD